MVECTLISKNRKATHDFHIEQTWEAGLVLKGSEVKALRQVNASLAEGYGLVQHNEVWLVGVYIPCLKEASYMNHGERRDRKLLLTRKEIANITVAVRQKGYALIPLELYFDENNRVKVKIGLGKGKTKYDKRDSEKEKESRREIKQFINKK